MTQPNKAEQELLKRFWLTIFLMIGIVGFMVVALVFFAPKVGSIFLIFSKYRNEKEFGPVIKPTSPIFANVPKYVKSDELKLEGHSQPGSTVILFVNGPEKARTTAGSDGLFVFDKVKLIKGQNSIFGKSVNLNNEESEASQIYTIQVDTKTPKLEVYSPKEGDVIKNLNKRVLIRGKADEKCSIKINGHSAIQRDDFTFEFLLGVEEGKVEIKIEVLDEAQNKLEQKINITYQKTSS